MRGALCRAMAMALAPCCSGVALKPAMTDLRPLPLQFLTLLPVAD